MLWMLVPLQTHIVLIKAEDKSMSKSAYVFVCLVVPGGFLAPGLDLVYFTFHFYSRVLNNYDPSHLRYLSYVAIVAYLRCCCCFSKQSCRSPPSPPFPFFPTPECRSIWSHLHFPACVLRQGTQFTIVPKNRGRPQGTTQYRTQKRSRETTPGG